MRFRLDSGFFKRSLKAAPRMAWIEETYICDETGETRYTENYSQIDVTQLLRNSHIKTQ